MQKTISEGPSQGGTSPKEAVNHPAHYRGDTTYEAIKVIRAWGLGFSLGNAVKYICRAEHKGRPLQDLEKALWYLQEEIDFRRARAKDAELQVHLKPAFPIPQVTNALLAEVKDPHAHHDI